MEKQDFRKLPKEAREAIKHKAIKSVNKGMTKIKAAKIFGVRINTICTWIKKYNENSNKIYKDKPRGRKKGEKRTLTPEQEILIQNWIIDKHPEQLKLPFALWTRDAIRTLIKKQLQIDMPIRTVGEYLKRWNFTPKKPVKLSYEQQPEKVKEWLDVEYPEIKKQAKIENAEILWCDETGINNQSNTCRGYSPKGKKTIVKVSGKRFSISMVSAITNEGEMRYMIYKGGMNTEIFIEFLKRLIYKEKRKKYLIVDNLRVHHAKDVTAWLKEHSDKISIFYLPPYTPERNPDEYVNQDLKLELSKKPKPRSAEKMEFNLRSYMEKVKRNVEKVKSFFQHKKVTYAAAE